jgi:hypothetical protein
MTRCDLGPATLSVGTGELLGEWKGRLGSIPSPGEALRDRLAVAKFHSEAIEAQGPGTVRWTRLFAGTKAVPCLFRPASGAERPCLPWPRLSRLGRTGDGWYGGLAMGTPIERQLLSHAVPPLNLQ